MKNRHSATVEKRPAKENYTQIAYRVSIITLVGNALLTIYKLSAGLSADSTAMVSDAVHSGSDVLSTIVVMIGIFLAARKADQEHPYGHERLECVAAILLAAVLAFTGVMIGRSAFEKITSGQKMLAVPGRAALIAAVISIAVKESMYWYTRHYALILDSAAMRADAWHHRSDAFSSVGALIGIGAARCGYKILDPIAGLVIFFFICKAAYDIFKDAAGKMVDRACEPQLEQAIYDCIQNTESVLTIDLLQTRVFGNRIYVDAEIGAAKEQTLYEAHEIAERVHRNIEANFPKVKHIMVHVNPKETEKRRIQMKFQDMPYVRVDFDEVKKEMEQLMQEFDAAKSGEEQFAVHQKFYALDGRVRTMMILCEIRSDIDTTDAFYKEERKYCDEMGPVYTNLLVAYRQKLYDSPYRSTLEKIIGPVAFCNMEIEKKSFDEKLIPLMQQENALVTRYNTLIAGARIPFDGKECNLSLMQPYLVNTDRSIRKEAWQKVTEFFESAAEELDEIYDQLVKNRTEQARMMGYDNYLQLGYYRMNRNCYGKEEVERFRKQVKAYFVPFAERLHDKRRERLGLSKLTFVDEGVYFVQGNPRPIGTPEEIMEAGMKMYADLSPETKEFFSFMMENQLFDVLGRKSKKAGGYMTYLPDYEAPFIFANFNGTSGDVDVITHECGHAFQGYLSGKDPIKEHANITMETAEIHSMSMEFFTDRYMKLFFGERTEDFLQMQLEDSVMFIPYGCMVDEFQHIVYENPELTPKERKAVWQKLEREYKPHLDYEDNTFFGQGGFWQKQLHIYNYPLYYIDYCIAQTCALQFKVRMDADFEGAFQDYLKLCKLSASDFFTNMIPEVGLKSPFEDGCVENIVNMLEKR